MYNRKFKRGVKPIEDRTKIKNDSKSIRFTQAERERLEAFLNENNIKFTDLIRNRLKDIIEA